MPIRRKLTTGPTITLHCGCPGSPIEQPEGSEYAYGYSKLKGLVYPTPSKCPKCHLHRWVTAEDFLLLTTAVNLQRGE